MHHRRSFKQDARRSQRQHQQCAGGKASGDLNKSHNDIDLICIPLPLCTLICLNTCRHVTVTGIFQHGLDCPGENWLPDADIMYVCFSRLHTQLSLAAECQHLWVWHQDLAYPILVSQVPLQQALHAWPWTAVIGHGRLCRVYLQSLVRLDRNGVTIHESGSLNDQNMMRQGSLRTPTSLHEPKSQIQPGSHLRVGTFQLGGFQHV